jgi:hypothetical protein
VTSTERPHGQPNTYKNGCRCAECREANRVYQAAANKRRSADPALADAAGHGRPSTYINYRCRCDACRVANTKRLSEQRARAKGRAA